MNPETQFSLFDSPAVGSLYKAGDWVKLRRKPEFAASVKRGEVFQIDKVHLGNGSMRFWNPHINQWDFLYPDEVKLAPPPIDSVTLVDEPVVTESKAPPAEIDSVTLVDEPVVTESNPPGIDSVTSNAISTYRPRGTARSGEYFRFTYRDGSKVRHIHIKGGNTGSPIAIAKVHEVRSLLTAGVSPRKVAVTILRWRGTTHKPLCD